MPRPVIGYLSNSDLRLLSQNPTTIGWHLFCRIREKRYCRSMIIKIDHFSQIPSIAASEFDKFSKYLRRKYKYIRFEIDTAIEKPAS